MATVLDRIPVDEITAQAREVHFGRTVLTVIAAVLYFVFGWLPGKAWLAVCWCGVAVRAGWRDARRPHDGGG